MDNIIFFQNKAEKATEFVKKLQQWQPCLLHTNIFLPTITTKNKENIG